MLPKLEAFADRWQIVHLTGLDNYKTVLNGYSETRISHKVLDYYDGMADLFAATDLVIGRSGAVSVAEYAVAGVPSICMPYPVPQGQAPVPQRRQARRGRAPA